MKSVARLKHHGAEEEVDDGTWALSYGDMITLLLSFFVIFFTTDFKEEKAEKLNRHLSLTLEGATPVTHEKTPNHSLPEIGLPEVKAVAVDGVLVVTFGKISFFDSGSLGVHEEGHRVLQDFAAKFLPYAGNYRIAVKGFTDKRKVLKIEGIQRKYDDNLELSALRSLAAMRILQRNGIPLDRMEIAGVGEMRAMNKILPEASGLTETELNALSRTIVVVVKPEKESWL